MTKVLSITFITIAAFLYSCSNGQTQNGKTNLSAEEFAQKIKELPDAPIIDVRTADEFSKGHIQNAQNFDWEELQFDQLGNIYIGDIGNNNQSRNGLTLYKFHRDQIGKSDVVVEEIDFYYPEQLRFPPKRSERNFDAEAFLVQRDSIFIFTKDWSKPFNGISKIYYVPNKPGRHAATLLRTFQTNNISPYRDAITGVCWLGKDILILAYGAIYHIKDVQQLLHTSNFVQSKKYIFKKMKQFEAIATSADGKIYITTEKHRILGRAKLYLWSGMEKR
jgi:hypothetical protein